MPARCYGCVDLHETTNFVLFSHYVKAVLCSPYVKGCDVTTQGIDYLVFDWNFD